MKTLENYIDDYIDDYIDNYIDESIKQLPNNKTGIIVFDIDDTLLKSNPDKIAVYKNEPGKPEKRLTTTEFAKDPDAEDPNKVNWFDYREFSNPYKVYNSIITATPLINNLKILDDYVYAGYDFCFLTARACEETIKKALDNFLLIRNKDTGKLTEIGKRFNKVESHAINDTTKNYHGITTAHKKAAILKHLCRTYDNVVFVDDDLKNLNTANDLHLHNLTTIKSHME